MASSPPNKRQRIGSSALNAPFKSPVPRKGTDPDPGKSNASPAASTLSSSHSSSSTPCKPTTAPTSQVQYPPLASRDRTSSSVMAAPRIPPSSHKSHMLLHASPRAAPASSSSGIAHDSELRTLQSRATLLTRQLSEVRNALDTATQAERLERHGERDVELAVLVTRWTAAARGAAEELLALAQDKVNAVGGLAAYRQRERERLVRRQEDFEEDVRRERGAGGGDGDGVGEEDGGDGDADLREDRGGEGADDREESEMAQTDMLPPWLKESEEDTAFSMGMLLASLGIDLKAIGYDAKEQQWVS